MDKNNRISGFKSRSRFPKNKIIIPDLLIATDILFILALELLVPASSRYWFFFLVLQRNPAARSKPIFRFAKFNTPITVTYLMTIYIRHILYSNFGYLLLYIYFYNIKQTQVLKQILVKKRHGRFVIHISHKLYFNIIFTVI